MVANTNYPWYEIVEGDSLEQGDILLACPIIVPIPELTFPIADNTALADIQYHDVIVMTQSCDLANDNKLQDIILCPHWDLLRAEQMDTSLGRNAWNSILKGHKYRYSIIGGWNSKEISIGVRVVDFGGIFSLPKSFVIEFAASQGKRLRLCPPYREHLSQSFARFFMRVGFPQDIQLPK
jgi:hypothetical protein